MSNQNIKDRLDQLIGRLRKVETSQGRAFVVGVSVIYRGKFGVVTDLNKDATDPAGSTVDIRLEDGTVVEKVKVTSPSLQRFRA